MLPTFRQCARFEVSEGVTGLLGANGSGKSTTIKLFLGLLHPTSGAAEVLGENPHETVEVRARLGYMPEHDCLPNNVSAAEFLTHMAEVSGLPPTRARSRAADTLRHVGLFEERYRPMGEYSTGMKQRVKLAQTLVHDPRLVFLDEPTAGLDPSGREEMLDLVRRTGREFGISLVISSHLMGDVERTCDRMVLLDRGRVLETDTIATLTAETTTLYVEVDAQLEPFIAALKERG
ncbi:MAG TPA: ABC transporter ATP-binding protein, partial [Candidatus Krumholzibacteria bacterium]|nr:ABC transporter ATP-binding protein [Candidatus Krumholzibacteria bacterium]